MEAFFRHIKKKIKGKAKKKNNIAEQPTGPKIHVEGSETDGNGTDTRARPSLASYSPGDNVSQRGGDAEESTLDEDMSRIEQGPHINVIQSSKDLVEQVQQKANRRQSSMLTGSHDFLTSSRPLTRDNTAISATLTDVTAYTTWRDNGEKSASEYLSQQAIEDVVPPDDGSVPYVERVKNLLGDAEVQSDWRKTRSFFLPCTQLMAIVNQTCVKRVLENLGIDITSPKGAAIVEQICGTCSTSSEDGEEVASFRKVLATLIRIGKHDSILDFMTHDPPINDQVLPLYMVNTPDGRRCGLALGSSRNTPIAFTTQWTTDDRENFFNVQWRLYPTFFAVEGNKDDDGGHKKVHYDCHPETILPFVYRPTPSSTWNHDHPGQVSPRREPIVGGFSIVSFHELHPSQQNLRRYTIEGPKREVAVKKLNTPNRDEFDRELKMLIKLTPLPTPHLAKLLATFEIQGNSVTDRDFCFMSERADSNLESFWQQEPNMLNASPAVLRRWVAKQCRGLAEGMQLIHDYKYEQQNELESKIGAAPTPKHGFHGDIKPGNILVYNTWVGHKNDLGILQITDFGISSFHHTASLSGISRGRDTHSYRPPESNLPFMKTTQSHDIWTLGCLFLEFLTWLVKGPDAITEFLSERIRCGLREVDVMSTFFQVDDPQDGRTVISISQTVLDWAKKLCNDGSTSKFICDFTELVTREMLVIENTGLKTSVRRMNSPDKSPKDLEATATTNTSTLNYIPATEAPSGVRTRRLTAAELVKALDKLIQADDGYYVDAVEKHEIPDFGHHNDGSRQVIAFHLSPGEISDRASEQVQRRYEEKQKARQNGIAADDRLDVILESGYVTDASRQPEDVVVDGNVSTDALPGPSSA
ncbi:hypothetical protein V8F33_010512 [Rhypophila sp. PSN 637]